MEAVTCCKFLVQFSFSSVFIRENGTSEAIDFRDTAPEAANEFMFDSSDQSSKTRKAGLQNYL